MARGVYKRKKVKDVKPSEPEFETKVPEPKPSGDSEPPPMDARVAESRKALTQPLGPDQKFFESPEGYVMVGEAEKDHIWCRHANGGKGAWINPRR